MYPFDPSGHHKLPPKAVGNSCEDGHLEVTAAITIRIDYTDKHPPKRITDVCVTMLATLSPGSEVLENLILDECRVLGCGAVQILCKPTLFIVTAVKTSNLTS
jgi:hypothetical protein